jgi:predicted nucleic acid-binding protein
VPEPTPIVLDASVGVKWIKPEPGRDEALALLRDHRDGLVRIVVPELFLHEVVAVAVRHGGAQLGRQTWRSLAAAGLTTVGLDDRLAEAALRTCEELGCSFYDALAPAVARELGATLYSADARAHANIEGVRLI